MTHKKELSHVDKQGFPTMVDVGNKKITTRMAWAQSIVWVGKEIMDQLKANDFHGPKGPIFHTAIIAGTQAVKKTHELIPFCHPLLLDNISVTLAANGPEEIVIDCRVGMSGKTGVEMEALTGASVAALTLYDMCKALSHHIEIKSTRLMEKRGGKQDFLRSKSPTTSS